MGTRHSRTFLTTTLLFMFQPDGACVLTFRCRSKIPYLTQIGRNDSDSGSRLGGKVW